MKEVYCHVFGSDEGASRDVRVRYTSEIEKCRRSVHRRRDSSLLLRRVPDQPPSVKAASILVQHGIETVEGTCESHAFGTFCRFIAIRVRKLEEGP